MCPYNANMVPVSTVWWSIVASVFVTLLVSWLGFHHLLFKRNTYPKFCQRLEYFIEWLGYWLQRLWYALLFIGSTTYIVLNFEKCSDLSFTPKFNGFNMMFVFWLILLILPLFEKIEGFGVNLKLHRQNKISTVAASKAMDPTDIMSVEELDQMHKEGGEHE